MYISVHAFNKTLGKLIVEKKATHAHMTTQMIKGVKEYREFVSLFQKAKVIFG